VDGGPLAAGVDALLTGAVLVDHAQDWQADLAAERYNALVAYLSLQPHGSQDREAGRQAVLEELYLGARAFCGNLTPRGSEDC
jgi:hypothetical protein